MDGPRRPHDGTKIPPRQRAPRRPIPKTAQESKRASRRPQSQEGPKGQRAPKTPKELRTPPRRPLVLCAVYMYIYKSIFMFYACVYVCIYLFISFFAIYPSGARGAFRASPRQTRVCTMTGATGDDTVRGEPHTNHYGALPTPSARRSASVEFSRNTFQHVAQ